MGIVIPPSTSMLKCDVGSSSAKRADSLVEYG